MNQNPPPCRTILIVEDDFTIREAMKDALESQGYRVVTAENGQIGLEKAKALPKPCLVLLDMLMPVMNGRQFLDALANEIVLAPIPVVIVSASLGKDSGEGAQKVLKKPVDLEVLFKIVEQFATK